MYKTISISCVFLVLGIIAAIFYHSWLRDTTIPTETMYDEIQELDKAISELQDAVVRLKSTVRKIERIQQEDRK